jgi:NAD(P)-dependent dehydrogenase (short-subunit alcohol dehydrogenase family)
MLDRWSSNAKDAKKCWGMMRGYQQSKLANILFARALASRYNDKQITAYSVYPGVIKTNLGQSKIRIYCVLLRMEKYTIVSRNCY